MIKGLPYIIIIVGILGFFINIPVDELQEASLNADSGRENLIVSVAMIFNLPWWGNAICIIIGFIWLWLRSGYRQEEQSST